MNNMKFNKDNPLRVITLFSGYDSQALACSRLKEIYPEFDYELVAWCEIEDAAIRAHNALFPQWADRNVGDITKVDAEKLPDCDFVFYSFPCQAVSAAGRQAGLKRGSGTTSSLLWECEKIIKTKRPKVCCMENVAALVSSKFIRDFHEWLAVLDKLGYESFTQVLDSSKYGVPQHRERVFCVSILITEDDPNPKYHFPKPFKLKKCLADVLEENVDESYFLSDEMLARFCTRSLEEEDGGVGEPVETDFEDMFVCG